jgi:RNA polymerase sigma-70 factor (ECF subfamily)
MAGSDSLSPSFPETAAVVATPDRRAAVSRVVPIDSPLPSDDALSVARIFERHAPTVARWAARLGGPRVDVEDVVQDVFAIVSRKLPGFAGASSLETWLFGITDNVVRNQRRRWSVRRILVGWHEDMLEIPSGAPSPLEELEARRRAERAYAVLDRLPDRDRRVLILFELEEMSSEQIALLLGTKTATVRVWLFRAREKFLSRQRKLERAEEGS